MKSMRKLASFLFVALISVVLLALPALAFADEPSTTDDSTDAAASAAASSTVSFVDDADDLLSTAEEQALLAQAQSISDESGVGAYFYTSGTLGGYASAQECSDALVQMQGLEDRSANGCVVMLVCLNAKDYSLTAYGAARDTFTSATLDYLDSDIFPYLGRSDWAGAAQTYYGDVQQTLSGGKANSTTDVSYAGTYVTDDYGLFTDEQRASLEAQATTLAQKYNMGVYLLVVDNMGSQNPTSAERTNFATSFYRAHNLGLGSGKDGIMLVIAAGSRDYVTIAYGQGSYSFSDEGVSAMEDDVTSYLSDNDWYGGSKAYYDVVGDQLEYYSVKGEPWTEPDLLSLLLKFLAILGIPALTAHSVVRSDKAAMKTAVEQSEASNYLVPGSLTMVNSSDEFVHTSLVTTPIPKHESSGDSGFGGGGWGGGGGGGFSSSGGGKF